MMAASSASAHQETPIVRFPLKWSTRLSCQLDGVNFWSWILYSTREEESKTLARAVGSELNRIFHTHYDTKFGVSRNPGAIPLMTDGDLNVY